MQYFKTIISTYLVLLGKALYFIYNDSINVMLFKFRYSVYSGWKMQRFKVCGVSCRFYPPDCYIRGKELIELGDNIHFGKRLTLTAFSDQRGKTLIKIGDNCVFGNDNHITATNSIIIGKNLRTGPGVLISDNSHGNPQDNTLKSIHPDRRPFFSKGPIHIGDNVWLGEKCSIMGGVKIGDGVIIGANSVVTHDIPSYSVAVGVPAKIVKYDRS